MNPLEGRLAALRRRLRLVVTLRGFCLATAILLTGLLVSGLVDFILYYWIRVESFSLLRAIFLVGTLALTSVVAYLLLLRPLAARTDDLSLALRVEEQYPILNDSLASTVQFLDQAQVESPSGTSPSLRKEAVQRALRLAQGCDFSKAVNPRGLGLSVGALVVVLAILVPLMLLGQARAWTAVQRFADPFGDHPWRSAGTETQLDIVPGKHYPQFLAIGQPLAITGDVRGVIPAKATIQFEDSELQTREVEIKKKDDGTGIFLAGGIKPPSHRREIRFCVKANDALSPSQTGGWHVVALRQAPQLVALNGQPSPQISYVQPKYTRLPEHVTLPPGTGNVNVVAGTHVTLRGATDMPIARAWIEFKPLLPGAKEALGLALLGSQLGGLDLAGTVGLGASGWGRIPGRLDNAGREFTISFLPGLTGAYVLTIEDADGLAKSYEFDLNVQQDPLPIVNLLRPATSQSVLANAEISLQIDATDDVYGLRSVYLEYRRKDKHGQWVDPEPKKLHFYDRHFAAALLPLPREPRRMQLTHRWSLKGLAVEGETIVIQACADDHNNVSAFPQPGRSHEVELKIVGKQGLAQVIDEQEAQFQQKLLLLRDMQERAIKKLIGVEQQLKANGKLRPEDLVELTEVDELQKEIQARIGAKKDEGLRAELAQFEQMLKDNKQAKSEAAKRARDVREELDRINREHLPKIEADLDKVRRELDAPPKEQLDTKKSGDLAGARQQQEKVQQALNDLLKFMEEHSTLQQIKGELRAILQEQKERLEEVDALHDLTKRLDAGGASDPNILKQSQHKADLRKTAEWQRRLSLRARKLLDDMEAMAVKLEGKEPALHEMLQRSLDIAKPRDVNDKQNIKTDLNDAMLHAAEQLADDFDAPKKKTPRLPNLWGAHLDMAYSVEVLEKMLAALDQGRADELERLTINQKKSEKNLDDLGKRMGEMQKKIDAAMRIADAQEREKALQKLANEMRALQKEADQRAGDLTRQHAKDAAEDMKAAAKKLERVAAELDRAEDPKDALKQAKEKIDDAKDKLKEANEIAEEELFRERIAKIVDQLKGLKERQDGAMAESERLLKSVLQNKCWELPVLRSLFNLGDTQLDLAKDASMVGEKLKAAKVYHAILLRTVKDMKDAEALLKTRQKEAVPRQAPHICTDRELSDEKARSAATIKLQRDASMRLQRLIDALLPELDPPPPPDDKGGDPKGDGGDGQKQKKGGIQAQDGIPDNSQLKALKAEQVEINALTKDFAERHPDFNNLTPPQQTELDGIRAEQERLLELFREMITSAKAEGGKQQ
jgi:hypothetical protein